MSNESEENPTLGAPTSNLADKDGHFRRKASQFRNWVTTDPAAEFPAEKGRYVLYLNFGCPWYDDSVYFHYAEHTADQASGLTVPT